MLEDIQSGGQTRLGPLENEPENAVGSVYLLYDHERALLKIGFTTRGVARRQRLIEAASGADLTRVYCFPGTRADEAALHGRFGEYRVRGEWFRASGALLDWAVARAGHGTVWP